MVIHTTEVPNSTTMALTAIIIIIMDTVIATRDANFHFRKRMNADD